MSTDVKTKYEEDKKYIIEKLSPVIKKHVKETVLEEREDLEQEMWIKVMEKIDLMWEEDVPGFFEYVEKLDKPIENSGEDI
ncbi:hypothetical protein P4679_30810 [Priestia megaterium]|uniref:hypothetical protein n=1 Tax=Priestia megaterium TaxID=1404 RepID=UPI002E1D731A|nr:hypothetical protein [Priestia megaterium]